MTVTIETTYAFHPIDEYDELKRFEADVDTSVARKYEDTTAVSYVFRNSCKTEYKGKDTESTDCGWSRPNE